MRTRQSRWRALLASIAATIAIGAAAAGPAAAITDGTPTTDYPYVGLMTAHAADGDYLWRCSGTLISPRVFVTAGHCTFGADYAVVYFDAGPIQPDPDFTLDTRSCDGIEGYPCGGGITGDVYTSPNYDDNAFYLNDVGVVVLDKAVRLDEYGTLPEPGQLDGLAVGTPFTAVGYGLQEAYPDASSWKDVAIRQRMVAYPTLMQIDTPRTGDFSILLSSNANTGGTCFGDSGGPNFLGDTTVIAGVTSYGWTDTCAAGGGVYRLDNEEDLAWISSFLRGGGRR